ncbi:MAG TPA: hypothetical protein VJH95_00580 [Candidatus Nanoarchaeia archaeon]|nr:hypothetical protein [Candidatus Nanoarchaeia archaeon]
MAEEKKEEKKEKKSFLKKLIMFFVWDLAALVIALAGAKLVDIAYHTFFSLTAYLIIVVIAIVVAGGLAWYKLIPKGLGIAIVIGLIMLPYMQLVVGNIDIYAVDPPEFRESVTAREIRLQMGEFFMTNDKGEEISVMKTGETKLYPGGNKVHVGTLTMPAGNYGKGKMGKGSVEVDIEIDLEKEIGIQMASMGAAVPESSKESVNKMISEQVNSMFNEETLKGFAPAMVEFKNIQNDGKKASFTVMINLPEIEIPFPRSIPYPTGTGGPDLTLDIVLNEMGFPSTIKPLVLLPPGIQESIGKQVNELSEKMSSQFIGMYTPEQFGPGQGDIEGLVKNKMSAFGAPGGCLSESECGSYCDSPENQEECLGFAKKMGIDISIPEMPEPV